MVLNLRAFCFLYFFLVIGLSYLVIMDDKGRNKRYHLDRGFLEGRRKMSAMRGKNSMVNRVNLVKDMLILKGG